MSMLARRCMATLAADVSASAAAATAKAPRVPYSEIPQKWRSMSSEEQAAVNKAIAETMKADWKLLGDDVKRAAYYVSFGPHGARTPVSPPGEGKKIFFGVAICIGIAGVLQVAINMMGSNERALAQKMNPITGITSEGYKGKGFVQSK
ncbi:cytochrome c oxidase subunit IV [Hymenopellis radicata]|nr:cytochrome c oxidase subunit IV [Hymenopellis radicata]